MSFLNRVQDETVKCALLDYIHTMISTVAIQNNAVFMYVISTSQAATLIQAFFQMEATETKHNQYKDFINIKLSLLLTTSKNLKR